jgi:hypothetical protein
LKARLIYNAKSLGTFLRIKIDMADIINLFSGKVRTVEHENPPSQVLKPTHFPLNKNPSPVSKEDVLASKDHHFRRDWEVTLASYRKLGLKLKDLKRHEVTLAEVGKAVSIASALKDDKEAVDYFIALATQMTTDKQFCIELGFIPEEFRGYVWSLNYQVIANAAAFAEYRLGSIIGRPLTRYIYF